MAVDRTAELFDLLTRRILILDGAMGTMRKPIIGASGSAPGPATSRATTTCWR